MVLTIMTGDESILAHIAANTKLPFPVIDKPGGVRIGSIIRMWVEDGRLKADLEMPLAELRKLAIAAPMKVEWPKDES